MKKALLILICLATTMAASMGLKAQEVTIMLKPGWTWICYPSADTADFATALGAFTPLEGDIIACEYDISEYFNGEWMGDIQYFYPGYGYMYYSSRPMPVFLTFNAQQPAPQVVVMTMEPTDIRYRSAVCGGTVTAAEGKHVFLRGLCWSREPNPTIDNDHTTDYTGVGSWRSQLCELAMGITYHVRAYAVSDNGLVYGDDLSFTTLGANCGDHGYVDLGLPSNTLWATCNVGATSSEEYGDYFAWGETQPKALYDWNTYLYYDGSSLTKYNESDGLTTLLPEDDAATANWGSDWRMPTEEEWQELYDNTTITWTTQNGVGGRLFTATNGNSIFLPAGGEYNEVWGGTNSLIGQAGSYWSSSLAGLNNAWYLYFNDWQGVFIFDGGRNHGNSVRPVHSFEPELHPGAIDGLFSVCESQQVYFSQGNLQYIGSAITPYWKFADNQWDYFGTTTGQDSGEENVDRDLFGWGTSGYNHGAICYQPWSSGWNGDYNAYGSNTYHLYDQTGQADWGYNPISNGGNQENQWRTLTQSEWDYVFNIRETNSGIRYAKAIVNDVNGIILLPDNWDTSYFSISDTNSSEASFISNVITASDWSNLEQHGVVFLPAAGDCVGTTSYDVGDGGAYWASSYYGPNSACSMYFGNDYFDVDWSSRSCRFSLRLVRNAE